MLEKPLAGGFFGYFYLLETQRPPITCNHDLQAAGGWVQSHLRKALAEGEFMINSVDLSVGARLRTGRIALGMSHEKLADALGVSLQQVLAWELGVTRIGASWLSRIAVILNVSPDYFFTCDGAACHAH